MLEVRESNSLDIHDRQVVDVDHVVLYELVEHIFVDLPPLLYLWWWMGRHGGRGGSGGKIYDDVVCGCVVVLEW